MIYLKFLGKPRCLAVLCEHEFVVIDLLKENGYPTFSSPYLSCLHSSPITCSQHVHNCPDDLWNLLKEAGKDQLGSSYPPEVRASIATLSPLALVIYYMAGF
jgi:lethal(2) giant larvae protein